MSSSNGLPGRRTRRAFTAESLAAVAGTWAAAHSGPGNAAVDAATRVLAAYAHAADPATRVEPVTSGDKAGGRFRTMRLVSQTWRGVEWTHELSMYVPGSVAADTTTMLLWIDGGSAGKLPTPGTGPTDSVKTLALVASAAGLPALVDARVGGAMPMVIDMLSLERHVELQRASFGGMSEQLVPYTSRGVEQLFATPRGRELVEIVDPYAYRDQLVQPKVIALGTNDPYWPLESLGLYLDGLEGPRWVSYAPNAGKGCR